MYTFCFCIKPFLTASNIDFSDILETPLYFVLPPWYIRQPAENKNSVAFKYIVFTDSSSCIQALQSMELEHPMIGMVIENVLNFDKE